jgi:uncharacterized protein involved in type VI secretion and phage assembly
MKLYRGRVADIADPQNQGRVKVRLAGFSTPALKSAQATYDFPAADTTGWCHIVTALAGPGYGLFCLPQLDDSVIVAPLGDGEFIVLGFVWTKLQGKPTEGDNNSRVFKTPAGHRLQFDEDGDITIRNQGGAEIKVRSNGDVEVNGAAGKVVTTKMICAYTGKGHPQGLGSFKAGT